MAKDTIVLEAEIKSNIGEVNKETKDLTNNFGAFGITIGGVKSKFKEAGKIMVNGLKMIKLQAQLAGVGLKQMFGGKMIRGAKNLFNVIKLGVAATGIGLLIVAFAGLVQYFKDSEEGASKFKEITSQLGVVVGNVSDIISNLGKSVFKLVTGDFAGFKEGLAEVTQGVKDFGETTKKEMAQAQQLEKDRLALQKFEREAIVEKARTEKDMMELRLKARDFEKFAAEERLAFMREANVLAAEQLEKDLFVAKEKLRFQVEENSYSKSTQQNLDDEAALQAAVFNLERSNFSERKRLKSEEQAIVKEIAASNKQIAADAQKIVDDEFDAKIKANDEWNKEQQRSRKENLAADKKAADDKIKLDKLVEDTKAETIAMGFAAGKALAKEGSVVAQAIGVAETIYNTQTAIMQAMKLPPPFNAIQAGITGVMGAAAIAKIMSTNPDGGGGGGGVTSPPSVQTPSPQMMSGAFDISGGVAPEPTRAYVVTDEMTNSQNQLANIRRRATI